jgi:hypothetical protein
MSGFAGFSAFLFPTAEEHYAAGQDEQERHHQKGEDPHIGRLEESQFLTLRAALVGHLPWNVV